MFKPCKETKSKNGVALVMVLGLLTVMIILAVSFAVSMRTERLASGNYADTVRARELVHVALARAMNDLAVNLGPTGLYQPDGKVYPSWNVTNSYTNTDDIGAARWSTNIYLIKGEATNYIPRALWLETTNADLTSSSNHWLPIESAAPPAAGLPPATNLMGRVAYLILNCSSLLDANYAGSAGARSGGTNPQEIAIANLEEIGVAGLNDFLTARNSAVRYETLAQLNSMGDFYNPATNLFVYSRALPGYWNANPLPYGSVGTQVNLSGSVADLVGRWSEITNAFVQAGFSLSESGVLFSNLIDYVDDDSIPSNMESCVENVPMINEVVVSNRIEVSAGSVGANRNYRVITDVHVECWYPFVESAAVSFNLNITNKFSGSPGFQHSDNTANITPLTSASESPPVKYLCCHLEKGPFELPIVDPITLTTTIDPKVQLSVNVDSLKNPIALTTTHDGSTIANDNKAASFECLDPRFNDNSADLKRWRPRTVSPSDAPVSDVNPWMTGWWLTNSDGDVDSVMYVANNRLHSVAELSYLVYTNAPWKTVKLYGPNRHRVLDVFGLSTNTSDVLMTNMVFRGLVNCNSNSVLDATAVVFAGMPVDQYPGEVSALPSLTMDQGRLVAASIFNGGTYCTNLSDLGRNITFPVGTTELQKDSYFRNAFNLLNLRQNMFTIIIEAQAASGGNIPRNPAKQRAVAIVWRDPYTGEMFVRHLKWLGD